MDLDTINDNADVYRLVTNLTKHIVRTHHTASRSTFESEQLNTKLIKKLRSKAFEILLNKTKDVHLYPDRLMNEKTDAVSEILKHAFTLRLAFGQAKDAEMLEYLLDEITTDSINKPYITATLTFLTQMRRFSKQPESLTNIFNSSEASLLDVLYETSNTPTFEVCPIESLSIPSLFAAVLETQKLQIMQTSYTVLNNKPQLPCMFGFASLASIEFVGGNDIGSTPAIDGSSIYALTLPNQWSNKNLSPTCHFIPEVSMGFETDKDEQVPATEAPVLSNYSQSNYIHIDEANINSDSSMHIWKADTSEKIGPVEIYNSDAIWNQVDITSIPASNSRAWEYLGHTGFIKEPAFITDLSDASIHLIRIRETTSLPLLLNKTIETIHLLEEVTAAEFLKDVKSLILGVASNCFKYIEQNSFELRKGISVYGIGPQTLDKVCQEAILWGNCYKFLSGFVSVQPQTGKLQREGLIFKAMCTSIRELLLYYHASLLRIISRHEESEGLLSILRKVRPVAKLIVETARLCGYEGSGKATAIEGNDILPRIYQEIVKVTDTKVAMVFYSILKSCCEVYFRFLQKWMFEGLCDDIYGEFMITTRPQYLRNRGHKFWTKSFCIANNETVPGFLRDLTDSILQCGKTVRLLRICDIKNPVCNIFATEQPEVKVCLSMAMLHDQMARCREYDEKGKTALGPILSLSSAIEDRKRIEKERAELVIAAQRDTMLRLNEERKEALRDIARSKRELLETLKDQAALVDFRKKKEKEDRMRVDNYSKLEHTSQANQDLLQVERQHISKYYENLLQNVDKRQARAEWRAKRMSHYEKRILAITKTEEDLSEPSTESTTLVAEKIVTAPANENLREENVKERNVNDSYEDENKNIMEVEVTNDNTCENTTPEVITTCKTQKNTRLDFDLPMNYIYRRNNETSTLQNFLKEEALKELESKMFVQTLPETTVALNDNATIPYNEFTQVLETCRNVNQQRVERPTQLSFCKLDNAPTSLIMGYPEDNMIKRKCEMTPNNNQLKSEMIAECLNPENEKSRNNSNLNSNINENESIFKGPKSYSTSGRTSDIETPMSCTTDKFTSSIQSPMSQLDATASLQASSSFTIDLVTTDTPASSQPPQFPMSPVQRISRDVSSIHTPLFSHFNTNHRDWFAKPIQYNTTPSLTLSDVEIIDHTSLQLYLKKSILIPLEIQSRLVNNAIIKYFLKEHDLLTHLHSLRSYFFLLNGEFTKTLTDSLYTQLYKISIPVELFNSTTLTNLLERAIINSFNNVYAYSELLSLSAVDTPQQLQISDPSALDCLCLNYKISWPLNIILDDTVMAQYGKVFKFLITSGRVSWVLQEDFNIMKRERNASNSEQYHKLQLYRHAMTQFMNALHNYLTCSVLHSSWAEFEKDLQQASTVDQIYMAHVNYIKRILSRCMLNVRGEKMRICLNNIFKVILKFHNRLGSQVWISHKTAGYVHPNFKKLEQMYGAFCELRAYMAHVAFKLAISGYQPHLMHFLNALNINHAYDLTVKTHRSSAHS